MNTNPDLKTNQAKFTYLIGAGASKHALPLVNEISSRINSFLFNYLEHSAYGLPVNERFDERIFNSPKSKYEIQLKFIQDLKELSKEVSNHASIDTLAKKLHLKQEFIKLKKLKVLFSAYMIFEQAINKPDQRYDSFLATILGKDVGDFPHNMNILSWNYDFQFEKAYCDYSNGDSIANHLNLNVVTKFSDAKNHHEKFGIYKLNGTTDIHYRQQGGMHRVYSSNYDVFNKKLIEQVIASAYSIINDEDYEPKLSFAWEPTSGNLVDIIEKAIKATSNTNYLVVIGYSFPFFNRDVDRKIISHMRHLKKVYFQAPDAGDIRERFFSITDLIPSDRLIVRNNVDKFLIPNEF